MQLPQGLARSGRVTCVFAVLALLNTCSKSSSSSSSSGTSTGNLAVTTLQETGVGEATATLRGHAIETIANSIVVWFEYGEDPTLAIASVECFEPVGQPEAGNHTFSCSLSQLVASTTYYFRAVGENLNGAVYGQIRSFTTDDVPPRTISYRYDADGARVSVSDGQTTRAYPSVHWNTDGVGRTKHIWVNGRAVATIEAGPGGHDAFWNHSDHLGSTRIVTDVSGAPVESVDYRPFGKQTALMTTNHMEQRKFTGHEFDSSTQYTYARARYLDNGDARFISQDPAFLMVGDPKHSGQHAPKILADPQLWNSYAYARNNPAILIDPRGEMPARHQWRKVLLRFVTGYEIADVATSAINAARRISEPGPVTTDEKFVFATQGVITVGMLFATSGASVAVQVAAALLTPTLDVLDPFIASENENAEAGTVLPGSAVGKYYPSLEYFQREIDKIQRQIEELKTSIANQSQQ